MNLTIDIGNTCVKLVAFDGTSPVEEIRMDSDELFKLNDFCEKYHFRHGIYSSVTNLSDEFKHAIEALPFPVMRLVSGVTPIPIINKYSTPKTLGTDRLAAAVGSFLSVKDRDILIIDVGTCITYDFVNSKGEYLGGNISPGPTVRLKSLHAFTDALPLIERKGSVSEIGDTTEMAIRNGVMHGVEYEIEGCISEFSSKYPNLLVYLTGGVQLNLRISEKKCIFVDKLIVPKGLNYILLYNIKEQIHNEKNNIK
ncbi:MAG: type III pantothenate kinase [Prevotella sp.]|nr:type III pantothenate kinase [Prevotella sp.]